jgi:cytochrome c peroxidase
VLREDYAAADALLTRDAVEGLRLFVGKGQCRNCHAGPLFTNGAFHALGVKGLDDADRVQGVAKVLADEFNCLGKYSDARPEQCGELRFVDADGGAGAGAFKTPTLRNVAERPPYLHAGQLKSLGEVLRFYQGASSPELGHGKLTTAELASLESFLHALSAPLTSP